MKAVAFAPDQSSENESPGWSGKKDIAIERLGKPLGGVTITPDFISRAIFADTRIDKDRDGPFGREGRGDDDRMPGRGGTVG